MTRLSLGEGPHADWKLLATGSGNPIGNLRIKEAAPPPVAEMSKGFRRSKIIERHEGFMDYVANAGGPTSGSTGAGGDAPKFLLSTDTQGLFHADAAIPDSKMVASFLVKFPRGKKLSDRQILKAEANYLNIAKAAGANVASELYWEKDCLFIPRFDRVIGLPATNGPRENRVLRLGVESMASACGRHLLGQRLSHQEIIAVIVKFSSEPSLDCIEYLRRDILNLALGNTDNHGRNTALIKAMDGKLRLSPLFDFAPMFMDDQGITRSTFWEGLEEGSTVEWNRVFSLVKNSLQEADKLNIKIWQTGLKRLLQEVSGLESLVEKHLSVDVVKKRVRELIVRTQNSLQPSVKLFK